MKHKKVKIRKSWGNLNPATKVEPDIKQDLLQDQLEAELEQELKEMGYHPMEDVE